jgi:hypothetical protein
VPGRTMTSVVQGRAHDVPDFMCPLPFACRPVYSAAYSVESFASAPSSTNARITSTCPYIDAQCNAVQVSSSASRSSTIAPAATNLRHVADARRVVQLHLHIHGTTPTL